MSKQHLANMLKSMTSGDMDAAKDYFSKYATEKSQEILARDEAPVEPTEPTEPTEPAVEPTEPAVEPTEPVVEPTEDDNKA